MYLTHNNVFTQDSCCSCGSSLEHFAVKYRWAFYARIKALSRPGSSSWSSLDSFLAVISSSVILVSLSRSWDSVLFTSLSHTVSGRKSFIQQLRVEIQLNTDTQVSNAAKLLSKIFPDRQIHTSVTDEHFGKLRNMWTKNRRANKEIIWCRTHRCSICGNTMWVIYKHSINVNFSVLILHKIGYSKVCGTRYSEIINDNLLCKFAAKHASKEIQNW